MSSALYSSDSASVADVRRLEIAQLLNAVKALHLDGIIDRHEYRAKRRMLNIGSSHLERGELS
jgi:hypothetical protein